MLTRLGLQLRDRARTVRGCGNPTVDDAGLTLAEVLMGVALTSVAGAIGMSLFVGTVQQAAETGAQSQVDESSRVGVNQIANEIRLADSPTSIIDAATDRFATFEPYSITFYTDRMVTSRVDSQTRTVPSKVTIAREVDGDDATKFNVVLSAWAPGATAPQTTTLIRDLRNNVTTPTADDPATTSKDERTVPAEPLFVFCDTDDNPAQPPAGTTGNSASCGRIGASLAYSNDGVANSYRSGTDGAAVRGTRISSVIVSAKVVGDALQGNGGARVPTTWLTTRIALAGHVVPATGGTS